MGIVFDIKRFAVHDGPGIRSTVFLKGCPLRCAWCHNPESISPKIETLEETRQLGDKQFIHKKTIGKEVSISDLFTEVTKDKSYWEHSGGGVTLSGGEPLLQYAFTQEFLNKLKQNHIHATLDTCGYVNNEKFSEILSSVDLVLYDLKVIDDHKHTQYTGKSNQRILENFKTAVSSGVKVRVRIPLIPAVNDTDEEIENYLNFLAPYREKLEAVHLLPFHKTATHKFDEHQIPEIYTKTNTHTKKQIDQISKKFTAAGFNTIIGG